MAARKHHCRKIWFFRSYFLDWNLFEKILLALAIVVPITLGIALQSTWIQIGASSLMVVSALLFAKAKIEGYFLAAIAIILLIIVAWGERLYGEVGIQLFFGLPMLVVGFVSWLRATKKGEDNKPPELEIRKTSLKEMGILISGCVVLGVGIYFMLAAIDTHLLALSTFSATSTIFATILIARRSHLGTFGYVINDISNILLWLMIVFAGDVTAIVMIVNPTLLLINDTYGIFTWRKMFKDQEQKRGIHPYSH